MISFPKKSFYYHSEVINLLGIDSQELKSFCKKGLNSFFSETGKKLFLREDIVELYARHNKMDLYKEDRQNHDVNTSQKEKASSAKKEIDTLKDYRLKIQDTLSLISEIKSEHPQIWYNH